MFESTKEEILSSGETFSSYSALYSDSSSPHSFGMMYNSKKSGKSLCEFVQKNYKNPMKCAQKIVSLGASSKFGGIPKRHLHEGYLYLGLENYVQDTYELFVKTGVNSKGQFIKSSIAVRLSELA